MSEALDIRNANDAYSVPLDKIDIANSDRFRDNTMWPYFERLRKEDVGSPGTELEFAL